jgi:hypothetical protein
MVSPDLKGVTFNRGEFSESLSFIIHPLAMVGSCPNPHLYKNVHPVRISSGKVKAMFASVM